MGHPSRFSKHSYSRIFQQTVSALSGGERHASQGGRASLAWADEGVCPYVRGHCDYFPAQARPSADGPASINFSTVQSDVRITATFLLASQET
jgi:hypothetical protein